MAIFNRKNASKDKGRQELSGENSADEDVTSTNAAGTGAGDDKKVKKKRPASECRRCDAVQTEGGVESAQECGVVESGVCMCRREETKLTRSGRKRCSRSRQRKYGVLS